MQPLLEAAAQWYVITVIAGCSALGMLLKSLTTVVTTAARERSRREIAAYVAEGTIPADQGERLMRAEISSLNRAA